jgi:MucB/RseB N-terminal domain
VTQHAIRPRAAFSALVLGALCVTALGSGADAGTPDRAEELLINARKIATVESFAGIVEVIWVDDEGADDVERVSARGADGAFVIGIGARKAVGDENERFTSRGDDHGIRWEGDGGARAPRPGDSWELEIAGRRHVAGRSAVVVVASDDDGQARGRFAIDRETGQLLRRAVLDEHGDVVRVQQFVTIITGGVDAPPPAMPSRDTTDTPVPIKTVPSGFVAQADVGAGYRLLGQYLQPDGAVQLYYSDGLFTASVFQRSGRLDWDALPPGRPAAIDGVRARSYATPTGTLVVWGDRDVVLTAVGDGPPDAVIAIVEQMSGSPSDDQSWFDDVTDFVLGPFDWD